MPLYKTFYILYALANVFEGFVGICIKKNWSLIKCYTTASSAPQSTSVPTSSSKVSVPPAQQTSSSAKPNTPAPASSTTSSTTGSHGTTRAISSAAAARYHQRSPKMYFIDATPLVSLSRVNCDQNVLTSVRYIGVGLPFPIISPHPMDFVSFALLISFKSFDNLSGKCVVWDNKEGD